MNERSGKTALARIVLYPGLEVAVRHFQFAPAERVVARQAAVNEMFHPGVRHGVHQVHAVLVLLLEVLPEVGHTEDAVAAFQRRTQTRRIVEITLHDFSPGLP